MKRQGLEKGIFSLPSVLLLQDGVEVLVGINRDPVFGPVLTFGLGGIWVEILRDVSLRGLPVVEEDIREIKAYPLLVGARGRAAADVESLVKVMYRVARMGLDWPELTELDINPLYVLTEGRGGICR